MTGRIIKSPLPIRFLADLDEAARVVGPLWPLGTAIAVNPLWELRQLAFPDAVALASRVYGVHGYPSAEFLQRSYDDGRITDIDLLEALEASGRGLAPGVVDPLAQHLNDGSLIKTPSERVDSFRGSHLADEIDDRVAAWCAAFVGGALPDGLSPGFYPAWRAAIQRDPRVRWRFGSAGCDVIDRLNIDAATAAEQCLTRLRVEGARRVAVIAAHLIRLPGWAGHAKWRSRWALPGHPGPVLGLADYMAVRLSTEVALLASTDLAAGDGEDGDEHRARYAHSGRSLVPAVPMSLPPETVDCLTGMAPKEAAEVWLLAYEFHWRRELLGRLSKPPVEVGGARGRVERSQPSVQAVFCIDVRSEGIRRHLEGVGSYETFGFAGFFGLPLRFHPLGVEDAVDACPVLLRPTLDMVERPTVSTNEDAWRLMAGKQAHAAFDQAFETARHGPMAALILAEAGGFVAGPMALARTSAPRAYRSFSSWIGRLVAPPVSTTVDADPLSGAPDDEEQTLFAESALTTMGLVDGFAPLVVLCGHGATSENNPYASALDCGACGGNRGASSARAAAAILNRPQIRCRLVERGITIPEGTHFLAAEHDTVTDRVFVLDRHLVPAGWRTRLAQLEVDLASAGRLTARERAMSLPGTTRRSVRAVRARATDWAQIRPEWALARNAAFVVGPRSLTSEVDLERRVFLHSYVAALDPEGRALETILTAPMVVAHWINAQYYFSTVAPEVFSSGDKVIHNVIAGIGVLRGVGGDLGIGLPLQSLFDGDSTYHEPMRLLTVVEAPRDRLDRVVARNPVLKELFDGWWVHLVARDGPDDTWAVRYPGGEWDTLDRVLEAGKVGYGG
ncbi:MAG: DUF2309 domain-containing protein [Ferrimicrobium sp.]